MAFSSTTKLTLGLLAGAGEYPLMVAQGARRAGVRVVCAGFRGATGRDLPPLCDVFRSFRVGAVEKPRDFFREQGVTHVMMAGQIKPACIYTMWPDATARRLLASMDHRTAETGANDPNAGTASTLSHHEGIFACAGQQTENHTGGVWK